jgi:hypothetical protein
MLNSWSSSLRDNPLRRDSTTGNGSGSASRSSSSSNPNQERYAFRPEDAGSAYVTLARNTVIAANTLISDIEDMKNPSETKDLLKKRNTMNRNLEVILDVFSLHLAL